MKNTLEKLDGEVWRLHICGVYVSSLGRVYIPKTKGHLAHYTYGYTDSYGYLLIGYKGKMYKVHRLVAECFIPDQNNYETIDHINRIKTDNRVENLRWANHSMQIKNRGKYEVPKNNAKSKKVLMIDPITDKVIKVWESTQECQRNGFDSGNVAKCCNNKYTEKSPNIYKGYKWQYVNGC